ncbi:hypothetical protein A2348_03095 [Candidatus Uhrbacteria bacterium RIFOXYB12_FULL_58_10]|nr:MAG: hypothetical protein A2348_03095 [Candidatus Uhrbacteria bacterium RIFOXYB12_FULL_58_10]
MARSFRIVVCGPPHSGKSVFVQQLRDRLLSTGLIGVIEGCPDGEGGWAGATDQDLVGDLRVKGKFTPEFVDWVIRSVSEAQQPVTLVDVGGIRSPENQRIFRECDAFIVLANPEKVGPDGRSELELWHEFGEAMGCRPLALLWSVLHGESSLDSQPDAEVISGTQAGLERGTRVESPVIDALVQCLTLLAGIAFAPGELEAGVHTGRLVKGLGISTAEQDSRLGIRPWHAAPSVALSRAALDGDVCRVWGAGPSWLYAALACAARGSVELWDIRLGYVLVPELQLAIEPDGLQWRVEEHDGVRVVSFSIPGGVISVDDLAAIHPPVLPQGAPVVLSGRGPHWLMVSVAAAYARAGHPVAVLALHETGQALPDGRAWSDAHPGEAPAVVVASGGDWQIGRMITVPVGLAKA